MPNLLVARALRFLVLACLFVCTACGGGGGGGGSTTVTFIPSTDLTLVNNGTVNGAAGIWVGEAGGSLQFGGVRFPLFPFVDNTDVILSAKLRIKQAPPVQFPYATHGCCVVVDYVDFGVALAAGDNATTVLTPNVGTLSMDATVGYKELDVTAQVVAAAAANDFTVDFFLRFSAPTLLAPLDDYALFEDVEGGLGSPDRPELVITYQ